ncbi:Na+/H+ antiporter [Bartonella tamiae]|uniref:Na+/H+ antiporter n=1 Tax=Bartonella tamiae Th239 TaxID=1094558 RepID=J1JXC7_9HYPH|nr:Na+/H+ antiporter [Bartonella tamiae]EJF89270.1 Na+/H+ antiporter [Bartonella tamiae Th239]EJF95568.1 Na+/H+ antiporter [Bartonella tamiae Th307]
METVVLILILLLAVVLSGAVSRALPLPIPLPLIQILVGALISLTGNLGVTLRPELFFLLFLPPLLFLDGWRIPKEGLKRDKWTILELALGLVIFTVVVVGFITYWIIPGMPLAVAFALAAIVSPTDPIAVTAIAKRVPIPKRLMNILEGESLLNDASGLVSMRFAVTAAMTGSFSLIAAFGTFLWTALAGLFVGVATTFCVTWISNFWSRKFGEETGSLILVSLLTPFVAYLAAEQIEASGILAAVAAGISMSFTEDSLRNLALTRIRRSAVWDTVQFVANGVIFVILGEQLPQIVSGAAYVVQETGHRESFWLIIYVLAIYLALALLRFVWVWVSLRFTLAQAHRRGKKPFVPSWRLIAATSVAGVRGTVTLAGVLTLPLFLPDGSLFPARDLAIFLATGVILISLIVASIALPYFLNGLEFPPEPSHQKEEERARMAAAEAAIKAVEQAVHNYCEGRNDVDLYTNAAARVMATYRDRLASQSISDEDVETLHKVDEIERRLRLEALKAERQTYYACGRRHQLSEEATKRFIQEVDLLETRFSNS